MDHRVAFTVGLDDVTDTMRLTTRTYALTGSAVFAILGLAIATMGNPWGLLVATLAVLVILVWRLPVIDGWLLRRRAASRIGMDCEVWLDDRGVGYRQTGMNGHFDWKTVTKILDDDRSLVLLQDGVPLLAIPKRAFASSDAAAEFVAAVRGGTGIHER